jgi:hypothetical protein
VTADRVAVLVSAPEPAVVVYDSTGAETSRTPVDVPADAITAADQLSPAGGTVPTPAVRDGAMRYSLIGDQLLGVSSATVEVTAPASTAASGASLPGVEPPTVGVLAGETTASAASPVETVQVRDLSVAWTKTGALGLPAVIGDQLLMPVAGGLSVFAAANGNAGIVGSTVPVDRGGYQGRVDAAAVGAVIIETRGDLVAGLTATG